MSTSVDGLVSGLSTSSVISQLMQVEAAPQNRLKTKVSTAQTAVTSYQAVNSKLSALKTAAEDIGKLATWRAVKPTSSSATVTATATGGTNTASGTTIFTVGSLAGNQINTAKVAKDGDITAAVTIEFTVGGTAKTVTLGEDKTAQGVAGYADTRTRQVRAVRLGQGDLVANSISTVRGGTAVATDRALYELNAPAGGEPKVRWRRAPRAAGPARSGDAASARRRCAGARPGGCAARASRAPGG